MSPRDPDRVLRLVPLTVGGAVAEAPRTTMATEADDAFVREHTLLVRSTARALGRELRVFGHDDDLVSYGFVGLLDARKRFERDKGVPFSRFAYYRIRGAILDGVRKLAGLPARTHARLTAAAADDAIEAAGEEWNERWQHEGAEAMGHAADKLFGKMTSGMLLSQLAEQQQTPETKLIAAREVARLMAAIHSLPDQEQTLVLAVYFEDKKLDDVLTEIRVTTRSGASRVHARALGMLKEALSPAQA